MSRWKGPGSRSCAWLALGVALRWGYSSLRFKLARDRPSGDVAGRLTHFVQTRRPYERRPAWAARASRFGGVRVVLLLLALRASAFGGLAGAFFPLRWGYSSLRFELALNRPSGDVA
ncbi:MAG TPA: hypothetical protein VG944_23405, partial [Fimbriimonas sp.]|nr:hypothetical protein [Fimbriimonas sp.]